MASMVELCIQISHTKKIIARGNTDSIISTTGNQIKKLYIATCIAATLYFILMIIFVSILARRDMTMQLKTSYGAVTSVIFILDSVGLLYTTRLLIITLRNDFEDSMQEEAKVLRTLFVVFTVSYLLRTVLLAPEGHWA